MFTTEVFLLAALILAMAMLYSSVGHAGASGYIAAMALFGLAPEQMKPTALILNIFVASIGTYRFARAGHFSWRLFLPFVIGSAPFAFLGGWLTLPPLAYKYVVGAVLLFAAWNLARPKRAAMGEEPRTHDPPLAAAIGCGGAIGLLAGLTGTGGGIFLSPILILMHWADPKRTAAVSAAFILVNSITGIAGHLSRLPALPEGISIWIVAAVAGGLIGSGMGAKRLGNMTLRRLLAAVLVIAAVKMILT